MAKQPVNVLIVGANASQHVYGVPLLDDSLPTEVRITFYDHRPMAPKEHLLPLVDGVQQGRVSFVTTFPKRQYFDVVIIAVATAQHAIVLQEVLRDLQELPSLFVLEKPLGVYAHDLQWYRSVDRLLQHRTVVNEPYHFMNSVAELHKLAREKPVTEVNAWTFKRRGVVNNHGGLKTFAIEFPHLHGVVSRFAGRVLDISNCQVNNYYRNVKGVPDHDANYVQFTADGVMYTVAQGLGMFTMSRHGAMAVHNNPPRTRKIRVNYTDGTYVELDIEPAFSQQTAAGILYFYDSSGELQETRSVPDNPRRFFAEFIVQRALQPNLLLLPGVGLRDSLARNEALLGLRAAATEITNWWII